MGWNEEIADSRKDTDKPLQTSWCPEALHHPLPSTQGQMRVLRTVVKALMGAVSGLRLRLAIELPLKDPGLLRCC
jgi:hypothetical protein